MKMAAPTGSNKQILAVVLIIAAYYFFFVWGKASNKT